MIFPVSTFAFSFMTLRFIGVSPIYSLLTFPGQVIIQGLREKTCSMRSLSGLVETSDYDKLLALEAKRIHGRFR